MLDTNIERTRKRHMLLMQRSITILGYILHDVTQEDATTLRDGEGGWTVLEVLCHLRDYDVIFYNRAIQMLEEEMPNLPGFDQDELAVERAYNRQDLKKVFEELKESRAHYVQLFLNMTDDEWERAGIHPEAGYFNMWDALMQVGHHDVNHLEQITRILTQRSSTQ